MKTAISNQNRGRTGFSIIEVVVCSAVMVVVFIGLYGGISYGFSVLQLARENLRANQILVEKLETIRLYTWEQVNSNGFIPATFQEKFFPPGVRAQQEGTNDTGLVYAGAIQLSDPGFQGAYSTNLKLVRVSVTWTNGSLPRTREIETLVARYGVQNQYGTVPEQ